MEQEDKAHWEKVWSSKTDDEVSWYELSPDLSLKMIREAVGEGARSVIDVGGGTSRLVDELLNDGLDRLAVMDVSETALQRARARLGTRAEHVEWITGDIRIASDVGEFDVWHDRALFHFLTAEEDRGAYLALLERTVRVPGWVIMATFGPDGPHRCSGLDVRRYDAAALERELGSAFTVRTQQIVDHETPRGVHQQFQYAMFARSRP